MIKQWTNAGASNNWYTASNWTPATGAGAWLPTDIAEFKNTGTATSARIDMSAGNLSLGAISLSARTRNLTIGNSSPVAGTGKLQLNGATVNGINNVILSSGTNIPPYTLFIKNRFSGIVSLMEIVLGNNVDNIVLLNGEEGSAINISAPISGAGKKVTLKTTTGSGGILTLSGANTYTGLTTVNARHGSIVLAKSGGGTLPANNDVEILDGKLRIKTNQTLRNVKVGSLGMLLINPGVKLTITGILDGGTAPFPGGSITGTVVFV
jgi:autotransporter-associated beta strand protein